MKRKSPFGSLETKDILKSGGGGIQLDVENFSKTKVNKESKTKLEYITQLQRIGFFLDTNPISFCPSLHTYPYEKDFGCLQESLIVLR